MRTTRARFAAGVLVPAPAYSPARRDGGGAGHDLQRRRPRRAHVRVRDSLEGFDPRAAADTDCVFVWGANPSASAPHQHDHWLPEAPGAVVVVDPVRTETAANADLHLQPFPGTDAALAFGLMHVLARDGLTDEEFLVEHALGWHNCATWRRSARPRGRRRRRACRPPISSGPRTCTGLARRFCGSARACSARRRAATSCARWRRCRPSPAISAARGRLPLPERLREPRDRRGRPQRRADRPRRASAGVATWLSPHIWRTPGDRALWCAGTSTRRPRAPSRAGCAGRSSARTCSRSSRRASNRHGRPGRRRLARRELARVRRPRRAPTSTAPRRPAAKVADPPGTGTAEQRDLPPHGGGARAGRPGPARVRRRHHRPLLAGSPTGLDFAQLAERARFGSPLKMPGPSSRTRRSPPPAAASSSRRRQRKADGHGLLPRTARRRAARTRSAAAALSGIALGAEHKFLQRSKGRPPRWAADARPRRRRRRRAWACPRATSRA